MIFAGSSAVTQSGINNRQANNIIVDNSSLSVTTAIDPKEDSDDEKDSSDEKGNKEVCVCYCVAGSKVRLPPRGASWISLKG
ncbi:hypothetical protein WR25_25877 [Diploscapter pachys]|uniref:Uncharacterized protein n=1 Tax=Diploscapter pachys TaxID=2018661 RepID=A0A2A2JBE8_9BILA|nr:hypothetical protein WR25_25877 [Diploscapter pachys]